MKSIIFAQQDRSKKGKKKPIFAMTVEIESSFPIGLFNVSKFSSISLNKINMNLSETEIQNQLIQRGNRDIINWIEGQLIDFSKVKFNIIFSLLSKKLPKNKTDEKVSDLDVSRLYLISKIPIETDTSNYLLLIDSLFSTASESELCFLYRSINSFRFQELFVNRAKEGVRSNMKTVFESIALNNPYPHHFFEEESWNQMVLKCLFINSPLYKVYKIDDRYNQSLYGMLMDNAKERWAANRFVSPELWRGVGKFVKEDDITLIEANLLSSNEEVQIQAALNLCDQSNQPLLKKFLLSHDTVPRISWDEIGKRWEKGSLFTK